MLTRWIIKHASAVITVCEALKKELLRLSISSPPITVLRNGVDLQRFQPVDRILLRDKMELDGTVLVSVGRLATLKGHDLTIRALSYLPDTSLLLVGDGPERKRLEALAESLGVSKRVRFLGSQPQHRLKEYYSVGDISILSSSREGWANVLLESMACGTPVVATDVGGSREVIGNADVGRLASERTPEAIAEAVRLLLSDYPDRCTVRRYAEGLDWGATSAGQKTVFKDCLGAGDH